MLTIRCHFHPHYRAVRRPVNGCETCRLLYAATHLNGGDQEAVLAELGSELAVTISNDKWEDALEGIEMCEASVLQVTCRHHHYQGTRWPGWKCDSCRLLYVLKYQRHPGSDRRLGPYNPFGYAIGDVELDTAYAGLSIRR